MAVDLIPLWEGFEYKDHQVTAVNWMLKREREADEDKLGGLLCDEMGLGKTMEVLGVVKNNPKPLTLLLCPKAVITQWQKAAIQSRLNVVMYLVTPIYSVKDGLASFLMKPIRLEIVLVFFTEPLRILPERSLGVLLQLL
jgi:SNF2 family DNA or RNA helicase